MIRIANKSLNNLDSLYPSLQLNELTKPMSAINIPTWITLFRLFLIPVMVIVLAWEFPSHRELGAAVFLLISVSDFWDGYLARKWNQTSRLGAFLDPVADKVAVGAMLVMLVYLEPQAWIAIPALIIVGRELMISGLREWMADQGLRDSIQVGWVGKWKTSFQTLAIGLMIYKEPSYGVPWYEGGLVCLYIAMVLTLWSMISYLKAAWPYLMNADD